MQYRNYSSTYITLLHNNTYKTLGNLVCGCIHRVKRKITFMTIYVCNRIFLQGLYNFSDALTMLFYFKLIIFDSRLVL